MRHLLVTRWNLEAMSAHSPAGTHLSSVWLADRNELFTRYCLPSVQQQTFEDFEWIMLVDQYTPPWVAKWLQNRDDRISILRIMPGSAGSSEVSGYARGDGWIVTTRLDSDDALCRDHLERVQDALGGGERCFIEFTNGIVYDVKGGDVRHVREPHNPFISLFEPAATAESVYCCDHNTIGEEAPVVSIERVGWCQVIHGGNVTNTLRGNPVTGQVKSALYEEFGIS